MFENMTCDELFSIIVALSKFGLLRGFDGDYERSNYQQFSEALKAKMVLMSSENMHLDQLQNLKKMLTEFFNVYISRLDNDHKYAFEKVLDNLDDKIKVLKSKKSKSVDHHPA